jgi:uncharacterized membrane protein YwzB
MNRWIKKHKQTLAMIIAILLALLLGLGSIAIFFA